jgi:hypothetical protein
VTAVTSWSRATVPSYLRPTVPPTAVLHGLRRAVTLPVKVVVRALAAYSPAAVAIWTKACATPFPTNAKRRSPLWTSASRPDACLDTWDGCGTAAGDILDVAGNLPACDKFGLSVTSILSVFTKFRV